MSDTKSEMSLREYMSELYPSHRAVKELHAIEALATDAVNLLRELYNWQANGATRFRLERILQTFDELKGQPSNKERK